MLSDFAEWLLSVLLFVPQKIWELLLAALAGLINSIPVPAFFSSATAYLGNIPGSVMYFAASMQIGYGISVILSAYVLRFIIRRLPVVG